MNDMIKKNTQPDGFWNVDFQPIGLRGTCEAGLSLLDCARHLGVDLVNLCGGAGKCGQCIVQVIDGDATPLTENEKNVLSAEDSGRGYRLACEAVPLSNVRVSLPPGSLTAPQRTQVESIGSLAAPEALVAICDIKLAPPGSGDLRSDYRRLTDELLKMKGISGISMCPEVLCELPAHLRNNAWEARVVLREKEIIGLADKTDRALGLAVDIGTTKVAAYLVDLESGKTLASKGEMNPQINYGEDIIARFVYAQASAIRAQRLQKILVDALNQMTADLCSKAGVSRGNVFDVVVVCNTAMHHLLLNLPTDSLSRAPYLPVIDRAMDVKASQIGLKTAKGAYVHLLPNIAGYVGSDHVAMLLAVGILQEKGVCLALDIGTNTEICLSSRGRMSSLSCASGPAFEGAHIKCGMRAADGAIERLKIENNTIRYQTIGGKPARGLCGSGILDVLAQMYAAGAIEKSGRMNESHPLIKDNDGFKETVLVSKEQKDSRSSRITFSQKDVREIQLAKGAIRTGIDVLLATHHLKPIDIDKVFIAGAFGSYIDVHSAKEVGMLPEIPSERFVQVGNAAGLGSRLALISKVKREEAVQIAHEVNYIELAAFPDFSTIFANAMYLDPG